MEPTTGVDSLGIKSVTYYIAPLQLYEDIFESKFLKATEMLYAAEGQRYMQEVDVSLSTHLFSNRLMADIDI